MPLGETAAAVGKGLLAGMAGTVAMIASSSIEARLRGRSASTSDGAGQMLGIGSRGVEGQARFSNIVHWGDGASWGAVRGLLHAGGIDGARATALHFAAVWGSGQIMLRILDIAPPPWKSPPEEVAVDALHHAVYTLATGFAFASLDGSLS